MSQALTEQINIREAVTASADMAAGTVTGDYFDMRKYRRIVFAYLHGAGATGTTKIQVNAASANDGTGAEQIGFKYRHHAKGAAPGALTDAVAATGFTAAAGADVITLVEVDHADCPDGKPWVAILMTEVVDSAVSGCVAAIMADPRYASATLDVGV